MSQITRCPSCATSFKVVADQLRISEGWVRCGQCKEVFDASAHLLPAPPPALLPDVSLTDVRPPPSPIVRKAEGARAWGSSAQEAPVSAAIQSEPVPEVPSPLNRAPWMDLAQGANGPVLDIPAPTVPAFLAAGESGPEHDPVAPFVWHTRRSPVPTASSAINAFSPAGRIKGNGAAAPNTPAVSLGQSLPPELVSEPSIDKSELARPAQEERLLADSHAPVDLKPDAEISDRDADAWLAQRGYPPLDIPGSSCAPVAAGDGDVTAVPLPLPDELSHSLPPHDPVLLTPKNESEPLALKEDDSPAAILRAKPRKSPDAEPDAEDDDNAVADPASEVSFVVTARRKAFWRKPAVRWLLVLLLLLSVLGLAVQMAVQERDRIAVMDARTRPWLMKLCQAFHCDIAPPRQIADVVIDSSSFNKARGDSYQLTLVMKNKATTPVAMPAVELTLTDAQDQPVLRRVLLPNDMAAPPELAAHGEWATSISVIVTTGGARVAGYRLLAFYP